MKAILKFTFGITLTVILGSCSNDSVTSSNTIDLNPAIQPSTPVDFNPGWIERLPKIDFVINNFDPKIGWPSEGQEITWKAHVKNWGKESVKNVSYQWKKGNQVVEEGRIELTANEHTTIDLKTRWFFEREELSFEIDHLQEIQETTENNNQINTWTDALSLAFYVEQDFYDYFHEHQNKLGIGSNSFEDWSQRQVKIWNELFSNSFYTTAPDGVLDRIRLDFIHIVPTGALPLGTIDSFFGERGSPNTNDKSVDLQWGFIKTEFFEDDFGNLTSTDSTNHFFYSGFVFHELMHARYLTHPHRYFDVTHNIPSEFHDQQGSIEIMEGDSLAVETQFMPKFAVFPGTGNGIIHRSKHGQGVMTSVSNTGISELSTVALNNKAGIRPASKNYHVPDDIGYYVRKERNLPLSNIIILKDQDGNLILEASVNIYASIFEEPFSPKYDNTPELSLTITDGSFSADDRFFEHPMGDISNTLIIRVETDQRLGYGFIERADFLIQYMVGNIAEATYEIIIELKNK